MSMDPSFLGNDLHFTGYYCTSQVEPFGVKGSFY
jgi:hypothetical protein